MAGRRRQRPVGFHIFVDAIPAGQPDGHLHEYPIPPSFTASPRLTNTIGIDIGTSSASADTSIFHYYYDNSITHYKY